MRTDFRPEEEKTEKSSRLQIDSARAVKPLSTKTRGNFIKIRPFWKISDPEEEKDPRRVSGPVLPEVCKESFDNSEE